MHGGNDVALQQLHHQLSHTSGGAPNVTLIGMSLSGAFSRGAIEFFTNVAKKKFRTPLTSGSLKFRAGMPTMDGLVDANYSAKCTK